MGAEMGELEAEDVATPDPFDSWETQTRKERKSPAAAFGSNGIGSVTIPFELQDAIRSIISGECFPKVIF